MANMSPKKNPIPEQDPNVRNKNFEEVALGYTVEMAVDEANRCLNCPRPACMSGCPVNVKIPQFIARVREQDFKGAYHKILEDSSLPAICGRVCPQEKQCESKCVRGIKGEPVGIGRLERFVADWNRENADEMPEKIATNGHRVAVIGSGPSGLACASDLAKLGYDVTVYEHFHKAGGVLAYGIPEFRLPKAIVQKEIDKLVAMGVNIVCDATIGKCMSIDELLGKDEEKLLGDDKYEAVFIGSGAGLPKFQNIPGLSYCGVFSANEFLTRINLMHAYDERYDTPLMPIHVTAVVGAGNVAMDAARCAKRLGADVTVVYRRGEEEIPARKEEYEHAKEEGINFHLVCNPVEILADDKGWVRGLKCIRMELGEPDEKGRRRPIEVPGSEFEMACDSVIMALGTSPNPLLRKATPDLEYSDRGGIVVQDDTVTTMKDGVFAGGDAVTGAATVIKAMGAGKKAAAAIDAYIRRKNGHTYGPRPPAGGPLIGFQIKSLPQSGKAFRFRRLCLRGEIEHEGQKLQRLGAVVAQEMTFAVAREGHGAGVHGRRLAVAAVNAVPGEEIIHFIVAVVGVLADFTAGLQHHAGADRAGAEHLLRGEERIALKVAGAALEVLKALGRIGELADECHRDQPPVSFLLLFVAHGRENCNRFSRGGR